VIKVAARRAAAIFHSPAMLVPMNAPNNHAYDTDVCETLSKRVMVGDGAMGTQLKTADLVETKYVRLQSR
jgi:hypothetical protein